MTKKARQVMFSPKVNAFLDGMKEGERSSYVNGLVERDIARKEKKAGVK